MCVPTLLACVCMLLFPAPSCRGGAGCDDFTPGKHCPGMTDVEYKTEFTLWAISASSMLVATDVRILSPLQREVLLNHELLAVNQISAPAGGLVYRVIGTGAEVWMRNLAEGTAAVAVFNPRNTVRVTPSAFRYF